jgi:hypothetical protein
MNATAVRKLNNGLPRLDFVNELTYEPVPGAGFLAASSPRALNADLDFDIRHFMLPPQRVRPKL